MSSSPAPTQEAAEANICVVCSTAIEEEYVSASGSMYHPEHFTCAQCNAPLAGQKYYPLEGRVYCETDFLATNGQRCSACQEFIRGEVVSALGGFYHREHFVCAHCKQPFLGDQFLRKNDSAYCREDYEKLFNTICKGCGELIVGKVYSALDANWHYDCFKCQSCQQPIGEEVFLPVDSIPYHTTCAPKPLANVDCFVCEKTVDEPFTADGKPCHTACFVCSRCNGSLVGHAWFEAEGKLLCAADKEILYPTIVCHGCSVTVTGPYIMALGRAYHAEHLQCGFCDLVLADQHPYVECKGQPCCERCFLKQHNSQAAESQSGNSAQEEKTSNGQNNGQDKGQANGAASAGVSSALSQEISSGLETSNAADGLVENFERFLTNSRRESSHQAGDAVTFVQPTGARLSILRVESNQAQLGVRMLSPTTSSVTVAAGRRRVTYLLACQESEGVEDTMKSTEVPVQGATVIPSSTSAAAPTEVPYDILVSSACPATVDPTNKEKYLSDADFKNVLGMDKTEFEKLPKWRQVNKKKEAKLF